MGFPSEDRDGSREQDPRRVATVAMTGRRARTLRERRSRPRRARVYRMAEARVRHSVLRAANRHLLAGNRVDPAGARRGRAARSGAPGQGRTH